MRNISGMFVAAVALSGCLFGGGSGTAGNLGTACAHVCQCLIEGGQVDEAGRGGCETNCQDDGAGLTSACYSCIEATSCPAFNSGMTLCENVCDDGGGGGGGGAADENDACAHVCDCAVQSGSIDAADEAACVTQCVSSIAVQPDACFACLDGASCTDLEDATTCQTECTANAVAGTSEMTAEQLARLGY